MENNVMDSGSRVTRSLRKRLTSVDSDNSGRALTPISTKLTLITEMSSSPSKPTRMTRRNSSSGISTPVKTSAKRGGAGTATIAENSETLTPAKKRSQRRSGSENEEISKAGSKIPTFSVLDEEDAPNDVKTAVVTRSQSKSPQQMNTKKSTIISDHPKSPKVKTYKEMKAHNINKDIEIGEDISDVEITVSENDIADIKNKSLDITTINLIDDESNQMTNTKMKEGENHLGDTKSRLEKNHNELHHAIKAAEKGPLIVEETQSEKKYTGDSHSINLQAPEEQLDGYQKKNEESTTSSQTKALVVIEKEKQEKVNLQETADKDNELKCEDAKTGASTNGINNINIKDCKTLKTDEKPFLSDKIEIISVSTVAHRVDSEDLNLTDCRGSSKKVEFVSSPSNDMTIKNIYPKTPASTKTSSNSFKGNESTFLSEYNSFLRSEINQQKAEPKIMDTCITPTRNFGESQLLEKSQTISSHNSELDKSENLLPLENSNQNVEDIVDQIVNLFEKSLNGETEETGSKTDNAIKEELKWIEPCVKGKTANGSKLDVVSDPNNKSAKYCIENADVKQVKQNESIASSFEKERQKEFECQMEELYKQKYDFHYDEAMEVNSYESGDSMDSEERREIEENEIPLYSRSIGSHTTEDEQDEYDLEEEDSEKVDSFIVSDDENEMPEENIDCKTSSDEEVDKDLQANKKCVKIDDNDLREIKKNLNTSKELDMSDISLNPHQNTDIMLDEKATETNPVEIQRQSNTSESNQKIDKSSENITLELSKLSDSAVRLHCSAESESNDDDNNVKTSRREALRRLNQSERLNKSVRDFNQEMNDYKFEHFENEDPNKCEKYCKETHKNSISLDNKTISNSELVEVSITPESDPEKENEHEFLYSSHRQENDGQMNASLKSNKNNKEKSEWQRSFTIDVTLKDGELDAAVTSVKMKETVSASSSSSDDGKYEKLKCDEIKCLENIRHMPLPLGNPLIRTRRQSLALPTNPDMEIGPSSHVGGIGKNTKRKSLGEFSGIDFNPSQSFSETIALHKNQRNVVLAKRKRLSKSFCGASDTHGDSIVDIDVRHLNKRSKLMDNESIAECHQDSIGNINSSKLFIKNSSTPYEKIDTTDSYNNNHQRILRRCDEILEAANRAKVEAKTNNKKRKGKISKKLSKNKSTVVSSDEINRDDILRRISKEIKRKDKTKSVLSQSIRVADKILNKKKCTRPILEEVKKVDARFLAPDVLEAIGESAPIKKKLKKETVDSQEEMKESCHTSTSAGNFIELPQSPQKKKKKLTYIQLATGKVSVEPITPKKHLIKSINGMEFRESPITPSATGFKVQQIAPPAVNISPLSNLKERKRKRYCDESFKNFTSRKSQWTQSGIFLEEVIPKERQFARSVPSNLQLGSQKTKKRQLKRGDNSVSNNFKENAIMRADIRRSNKREILLLNERRQVLG